MDATLDALIGFSANVELVGQAELPHSLGGCVPREKNTVRGVQSLINESGQSVCDVVTESGGSLRLVFQNTSNRLPAGGSINVAFTLRNLGVENIRVVAPFGRGRDGQFLFGSLQEREVFVTRLPAEGTALTVNVRDGRGASTLFCEKPGYTLTQEAIKEIRQCRTRLAVATSVKPADLPAVVALFEGDAAKKVFMPNATLLVDQKRRGQVLEIIRQSDLVQVNHREAGLLLGSPFHRREIGKIAELGAKMTVVTLGREGSIMMTQGEVVDTSVFPAIEKDTSGAGDTHLAALLYYLWLDPKGGLSTRGALQMAGWMAAKKVEHEGPWSGTPSVEEREDMLQQWGYR